MSAARLRLVECRAILGGERDAFRIVWDEQATQKDRKLLLMLAGDPPQAAALRAGYAWLDLPVTVRAEVKRKLAQFKGWAERLQ